jgi:hypothetical protein
MNNLTKEFHKNQFPGWKPNKTFAETMFNFWNSALPFLELPIKFNTEKSLQWLDQNKDLWTRVTSQPLFEELAKKKGEQWFFDTHSDGWEEIRIKKDTWEVCLPNTIENIEQLVQKNIIHSSAIPDLISQFEKNDLYFEFMSLKKLVPGGWLQPHRDHVNDNKEKFNYIWMPLNDCSDNLKIWPYGYIKHKTGFMYLFNNTVHTHSIINQDNKDRFVLLAKLDLNRSKLNFNIEEEVKKQWYS